jgi:hypothetical protein
MASAEGDWWRRLLLVASMIAACLVMPYAGFLPATAIAFAGSLIAARHEGWDMQKAGLCSPAVRRGHHGRILRLFRFALSVPLP